MQPLAVRGRDDAGASPFGSIARDQSTEMSSAEVFPFGKGCRGALYSLRLALPPSKERCPFCLRLPVQEPSASPGGRSFITRVFADSPRELQEGEFGCDARNLRGPSGCTNSIQTSRLSPGTFCCCFFRAPREKRRRPAAGIPFGCIARAGEPRNPLTHPKRTRVFLPARELPVPAQKIFSSLGMVPGWAPELLGPPGRGYGSGSMGPSGPPAPWGDGLAGDSQRRPPDCLANHGCRDARIDGQQK